MCNFFGNSSCTWLIIVLVIIFSLGGFGNNSCGCGVRGSGGCC